MSEQLGNMGLDKATGPDDVLIEYVTMLAKQDIRYVVEAMNQVLQQGIPEIWTKSRMVPIYKGKGDIKVKVCWTAQIALHFSSPGRPVHSDTNSAYLVSILAMQQLRNDYSLTCPPLSIARYSFLQLSRMRHREENENAQTSKR